jgi:DNA repair protein RadC
VQQSDPLDQTPIYPREVIKRALELSAPRLFWCRSIPARLADAAAIAPYSQHAAEVQRLYKSMKYEDQN